jgi:hypothetical protein
MVSVIAEKTISIDCKVKYDVWGDDMTLTEIPTSFNEFVKLFSKLFFPNNFSISYIDNTDYTLQPIDCAQTYRELISVINKSAMAEIKLLVNIFKDTQVKRKVSRKASNRTNIIDDIIVIKELSENSSMYQSEDCNSPCSSKGDTFGKKRKEKKASDVRDRSCISCY